MSTVSHWGHLEFYENSWRYLQLCVYHRRPWHRWISLVPDFHRSHDTSENLSVSTKAAINYRSHQRCWPWNSWKDISLPTPQNEHKNKKIILRLLTATQQHLIKNKKKLPFSNFFPFTTGVGSAWLSVCWYSGCPRLSGLHGSRKWRPTMQLYSRSELTPYSGGQITIESDIWLIVAESWTVPSVPHSTDFAREWIYCCGRWVANLGRWVAKLGRWLAS